MELIPAIDIISGKCVRLIKGNFKLKKVYSSEPLKIAQLFEKAGIKRIHLIDLEGAKEGKIKNWKIIKKIAKNTKLFLQIGGGIHTEGDIKKLLNLEIDRIILGTVAIKEPQKFKKFFKKFGPEKIIVALDIKKDKICYRGWQKIVEQDINLFLERLIKLGVKTIICTDIEKDGILKGPNFSLYKKLVKDFPELQIIASGGIRSKEDLEKLFQIGLQGAIIGKAIYENKIKISELKKLCSR